MSYYFASGNKLKILLHLVVWAVLFILPTYLLYGNSDRDHAFMYEVWFQLACYAVVFYLSYLWLAPRLFFSGRQIRYFISAALLIITFTTLFSELNYHFDPVFRDEVREGPPPEISGGGDSPDPFRPPRRNAPPPRLCGTGRYSISCLPPAWSPG